MNVSPDIKKQTEVLGYQNEVKKCHLMLHLKFDKVEEAKLEGSRFQSGITCVLDLIPSGCRPFHFPLSSPQILFKNHMSSAEVFETKISDQRKVYLIVRCSTIDLGHFTVVLANFIAMFRLYSDNLLQSTERTAYMISYLYLYSET